MPHPLLAITTFPSEHIAREVATALIEEELVACVNLLPNATSIYKWKGQTHADQEVIVLRGEKGGLLFDIGDQLCRRAGPFEHGFLDHPAIGCVREHVDHENAASLHNPAVAAHEDEIAG